MHPLAEQIGDLTRQARRTIAGAATARVLAVAAGAALVLMLVDYGARLTDPGMRWLFAGVLVAAASAAVLRWLAPAPWRSVTPLTIAQRIQASAPSLGSRLASALEFLSQPAELPGAGSADLRRAVVIEASAQLNQVDTRGVIDRRPLRRATQAAAAVLVGLAGFGLADPVGMKTAAARLLVPWADASWPRQNHLQIVEPPTRIARGQAFEVAVVDDAQAPLPRDLRVQYQTRVAGEARLEEQPLSASESPARVLRENVQQSFEFRVIGGDDQSMPWRRVEVVDPPRLAALQTRVTPLAYTGLPDRSLRKDDRILAGGVVNLQAQPGDAIVQAALEVQDESGQVLTLPLAPDSPAPESWRLAQPWSPAAPDEKAAVYQYRVMLTAEDRLVGYSERRALTVEPDPPPTLQWVNPARDLLVTSQAVVPIRVLAEDNLAIQSAALQWRQQQTESEDPEAAEQTAEQQTIIYQGPAAPASKKQPAWGAPAESRELAYELDLATLELAPGDQLVVRVTASDYRPGVGSTPRPLRISIVSEQQFDSRLAQHQAQLLQDLKRLLADQRTAHDGAGGLAIDRRNGAATDRQAVDRLSTLTFDQQRINQGVTDPTRGAIAQVQRIRAELAQSRLDRPELKDQLEDIGKQLQQLAQGPLDGAGRSLAGAQRAGQQALEGGDQQAQRRLDQSLGQAVGSQQQSIKTLEQLVERMSGWSDYQRFARELAELETQQRELRGQTLKEATRAAAAGRDSPERAAQRGKLQAQQAELSRRFGKLQDSMRRSLREGAAEPSPSAQALRDALNESQDRATRGRLDEAERQLRIGQLGMSAGEQQQAADDMQEMREILSDRASADPRKLAEQLSDAQQKLAQLQQQLDQLEQRAEQPNQQRQREKLAERTERLGRRMNRLSAPQAGQSAQDGAGKMQQSAEEGEAGRQSLGDAQQSLQQAQQQLDEKIKQLKDLLALRVLDRLAQRLPGYILRQTELLEATLRAEQESDAGVAASDLADPPANLADDQQQLRVELDVERRNVADREVFELAISGVVDQMRQAAQRLAQQRVDRPTQRNQYSALQRLKHVADALQMTPPEPEVKPQQGGGGQGGQQGQPRPSPIDVAELKMLRLMQLELNAQTRQLESDAADGQVTGDDQTNAADQLSQEQARLQELVRELIERNNEPPPQPGELPDDAV